MNEPVDLSAFVLPFISALMRLRKASEDHEGVLLSPEEVKAVVQGLRRLLNSKGAD